MGGTVGRVLTGIGTGGLSEVARGLGGSSVNNFMNKYGDPIYTGVGGALAGGALLGGAGAGAGGALGGLLGGGGGAGGSMGAGSGLFDSALGGSLLGYGLSMDPSVQGINFPNQQQDANLINQQQQAQQGIYGQGMDQQRGLNNDYLSQLMGSFGSQNNLLDQRMQSQRDNLMRQLTTGPEGEAFRQKYNNLGLLNSGALSTGLANQFSNLASQQQQDMLGLGIDQQGALQGAMGTGYGNLSSLGQQGTGVQSGLGMAGLGRQFGLEDQQTQFGIAKAIQDAQNKAQEQQALLGGGAYMMGQGGGGSGVGSAIGGVAGGIGNLLSGLLQKFRGGGVGSTGGATGNPSLDLYAGGNPYMGQPYGFLQPRSTF